MSRNTEAQASTTTSGHAHHWFIEEAKGPTSSGRCRLCGDEKEFRNWLLEGDFTTRSEHELAA